MRKSFLILAICAIPVFCLAGVTQQHMMLMKMYSAGAGGTGNLTIGKTGIGGSTSSSSTARVSSEYIVPAGGITVSHGYWYGTLAVGEYIKLSIWDDGAQQGDCSTNVQGDGSTKWYEVTWAAPVSLSAGQNVVIAYHPNGGGNNTATVDYYYDNDCTGCMYESGSPFNCNYLPNDTASTRDASYFVSNYDAH